MNVLRIALNDIRVVLKDRLIVFWWLAMPLTFAIMFSFVNQDPAQGGTWLPVLKLDDHRLAEIFAEQLPGEKYWVDVKGPEDEHRVDDWYQSLIIPASFSEDVLAGKRVDLTLTKGKGTPEKQLAAQTRLVRVLIKFNSAIAAVDLVERGWSQETEEALLAELAKPQQLSVAEPEHSSLRPLPSGMEYTLPAYMVMFVMMMTVMYGGVTLIEERASRRIHRLMASPVSNVEIFLGKMLARMLQPAIQAAVLIGLGVTVFGLSLGDHPTALIPVITAFAFFCGAVGFVFGVVCQTEKQVTSLGILTTLALGALGGCWWPLEVAPKVFQTIAMFTPSRWAIRGVQDVMSFGKSWTDVLPECAVLAAFGVIFMCIAAGLFRSD